MYRLAPKAAFFAALTCAVISFGQPLQAQTPADQTTAISDDTDDDDGFDTGLLGLLGLLGLAGLRKKPEVVRYDTTSTPPRRP